MKSRIIFSNNGVLSNYTVELNNYHSGTATLPIVATEDALFIGQRLPFNSLYFKFSTANTASSVMTISVWDGNQFRNVVETYDETSLSGATFGQSGYVSFVPDRQYSWGREDTQSSSGTEQVTGLGNVNIYDHYWVKITFSNNLDAGTTLSWIGTKFSDDNDLGSEYPDLVLSSTMTAWESGKTNWEEQHIIAAEKIAKDLKAKDYIIHKNQILNKDDFKDAAIYKVAEIAYSQMGPQFQQEKIDSKEKYESYMNKINPIIDKDIDGQIDTNEYRFGSSSITRGRW